MPKIRRSGFIFLAWTGDHGPRHVHVYRNGRLVLKWDLDNARVMRGTADRKVLAVIEELAMEGIL